MDAQQSFQILNLLALIFWIILIGFYGSKIYRLIISSGIAFILFGLVYFILLVTNFSFDFSSFSSLEGMSSMYGNPWLILLGWVHYLAFDLLAGVWIMNDSRKGGIPKAWVIAPLIFTFMTGPFGFLIYLTIKFFKKGNAKVA